MNLQPNLTSRLANLFDDFLVISLVHLCADEEEGGLGAVVLDLGHPLRECN